MAQLEENLRSIEMDGIKWGASTLVPLAFGIKKLQITLVVEDDKVSIDDLQEQIAEDEDHVQSTDVVSYFASSLANFRLSNTPGCHAEIVDLLLSTGLPC